MRGADVTMPAHKSRWLPHQCDLLERLLAAGCAYNKISERVGHPIFSCRTKASELRAERRRDAGQPKPAKKRKVAPAPAPKPKPPAPVFFQAQPGTSALRCMSTSRLVLDAELRGRISEQGITAGLLGDPRPGRSALDAKKAGA
jgi:hypothetical protein